MNAEIDKIVEEYFHGMMAEHRQDLKVYAERHATIDSGLIEQKLMKADDSTLPHSLFTLAAIFAANPDLRLTVKKPKSRWYRTQTFRVEVMDELKALGAQAFFNEHFNQAKAMIIEHVSKDVVTSQAKTIYTNGLINNIALVKESNLPVYLVIKVTYALIP